MFLFVVKTIANVIRENCSLFECKINREQFLMREQVSFNEFIFVKFILVLRLRFGGILGEWQNRNKIIRLAGMWEVENDRYREEEYKRKEKRKNKQ